MTERTAITILADQLAFPEGPAFAADGALWAVELRGGSLLHWRSGAASRIPVGGEPNGIAMDALDRVIFCDADACSIRRFDPTTGETITLADSVDGEHLFKPNDLAFDPAGNLVFTCPGDSRTKPTGYVCVLTRYGVVRRVASGFYFPNGLAFSPDGRHLVVAETRRQRLWRGQWDAANARWLDPRPWASVGGTVGPDGLAFAADGRLFVAIFSGGVIKVVTHDGEVDELLDIPGANPTNCAFDPAGRLGLVVTEAEHGRLLNLDVGVPGAALCKGNAS